MRSLRWKVVTGSGPVRWVVRTCAAAMTRRHEVVGRAILPVVDMDAAEAFHQHLGFEVVRWDDGYGWVRHDGHEVYHLALQPDLRPADNHACVYLFVDDLATWHQRARSLGCEVGDPVDQPWGLREISLVDPSGNRLRLGQRP